MTYLKTFHFKHNKLAKWRDENQGKFSKGINVLYSKVGKYLISHQMIFFFLVDILLIFDGFPATQIGCFSSANVRMICASAFNEYRNIYGIFSLLELIRSNCFLTILYCLFIRAIHVQMEKIFFEMFLTLCFRIRSFQFLQ